MAYKITDACIACGACAAECPVEAIAEGDNIYVVDADKCIDFGACMSSRRTGRSLIYIRTTEDKNNRPTGRLLFLLFVLCLVRVLHVLHIIGQCVQAVAHMHVLNGNILRQL